MPAERMTLPMSRFSGRGSQKGERRGGRKKGVPNKASIKRAEAVAASGLTPLEYMVSTMRDPDTEPHTRLDAAKAAAPYIHPKLAAMTLSGLDGKPIEINATITNRDRAKAMLAVVAKAKSEK
jgi:hypothetical protein